MSAPAGEAVVPQTPAEVPSLMWWTAPAPGIEVP